MNRSCPSCGTKNYGTPFCVTCQQPMLHGQSVSAGVIDIEPADDQPAVRAGFFRRLGAFTIDWLILSIIADILRFAYTYGSDVEPGGMGLDAAMILSTVIFILYFTLLIGEGGQTLGKMLMGIRVERVDGSKMDYRRAFLRTLGYFISAFFMTFLGFLWALWDKDKQAWHDKIAGTRVVRI